MRVSRRSWFSVVFLLFNFAVVALFVEKAQAQHQNEKPYRRSPTRQQQQQTAYGATVQWGNENKQGVSVTPASASQLQRSNFDARLYHAVQNSVMNSNKNLVISPYSLKKILAFANLAADGNTAQEIQKHVNFPSFKEDFIQSQIALDSQLQNHSDVELLTANKIYTALGNMVKREYKDDLHRLGGDLEEINFSQSDVSAQKINQWVEANTRGKITKLVDPGSLNGDTSWIIVNSVYFRGLWESPFLAHHICKEPFLLGRGQTDEVDMMSQETELRFAHIRNSTPRVTVVSVPYKGNRLSMMIYLPYQEKGNSDFLVELDAVEKWLSTQTPAQVLNDLPEPQKVWFFLPKFTVRSSLQLKTAFQSMGLVSMFDQNSANFSNIFENSYASGAITDVFQETLVEVTAEGTTAAVSSGFVASSVSAPTTIKVDRPFIFQILDKSTHTVLFHGRVVNPNE